MIDVSKNNGAISVLGVTTSSVLGHTSQIFDTIKPSNYQKAVLELSENVSDLPKVEKELSEYIWDNYKLFKAETSDLLTQSEEIGFVDFV